MSAQQPGEAEAAVSVMNDLLDGAVLQTQRVQRQSVETHRLRYIEFLVPGLLAFAVMQLTVYSVAFLLTDYRARGLFKRLATTPMRPYQFIAAVASVRLGVALLQCALFIAIAALLFGVRVLGPYWLVFLTVLAGEILFLGLGFVIASRAKSVESASAMANLTLLPLLLLGGLFFATSGMPAWLQRVANVLPSTNLSTALREVMARGAGLAEIWPNLLAICAWAVVLIVLAMVTFRMNEREG